MSQFEVKVVRVEILEHPDADALEIAKVGDFFSIVRKAQFRSGDLAVYIPEGALVPEWLLRHMQLWDDFKGKGMLAGSAGNRVKAIKLRGVVSQGLTLAPVIQYPQGLAMFNTHHGSNVLVQADVGDNLSEALGVVKWEPSVPAHLAGKVAGADLNATFGYDFENTKKSPNAFTADDTVVITEKLHGTLLQVGLAPPSIWEGKSWAEKSPLIGDTGYRGIVTSKGQGAKGLMIDPSDDTNLYVKTVKALGLWEKLVDLVPPAAENGSMTFLFGEIFGKGVQDLGYGQEGPTFRAFDLCVGSRREPAFMPHVTFSRWCEAVDIETVPVLYHGQFDRALMLELTNGNSTIPGAEKQIREGVVIKCAEEIPHDRYKTRRIFKSVSDAYLLRRGDTTEFN